MKSKLLALGLLTTSFLAASDDACCEPCEPCCIPKPKKCIDCECYTPAFYDLQCDWNLFITGDFLYWYAKETNLKYATKLQSEFLFQESTQQPTLIANPKKDEYLDTTWNPGYRIGIGINEECDGWDTYIHWTSMHNRASNSSSVPFYDSVNIDLTTFNAQYINAAEGAFMFQNPWIYAPFQFYYFDHISAKWKLTYNVIDLEIGRKYWLSKYFNLRPFAGLRGAWIKDRFSTKASRTREEFAFFVSFNDSFSNHVWGAGLIAGLQPSWYLSRCFVLFSNLEASVIWGEYKTKTRRSYLPVQLDTPDNYTYTNSDKGSLYRMTAIVDTALGLRWEESWCCDRFRTTLDVSWEHHIWFDQNYRNKTQGPIVSEASDTNFGYFAFHSSSEEPGTLGLGGLVVRLRLDF